MSKFDKDKWEPTLIYTSFLKEIAAVRKYGAEKYGSTEDWRTTPPTNHFNAIERHLNAHLDGEVFDQESGKTHLAHAASTLMMEIERLESAKSNDDQEVEAMCPRCKSVDYYPINMISMCTNKCRYVIDPTLIVPEPESKHLCVICKKRTTLPGRDTCDECVHLE